MKLHSVIMVAVVAVAPNRILGIWFLANFCFVLGYKFVIVQPEEIFWISHLSLFITGLGFLTNSRLLLSVSLTLIGVPHVVWLSDFFILALTGTSPLGVTEYLFIVPTLGVLATAHHFYHLPVLCWYFLCKQSYHHTSYYLAIGLFLNLTVLSTLFGRAEFNVNYSYRIFPNVDAWLFNLINALPRDFYLVGLNLFVAICIFLPTALWFKLRSSPPPVPPKQT